MNDVTSQASFRLRPPAREQLVESLVRQPEKPQKLLLQGEHLQNWESSLLIILLDFHQ